MDIIPWTLPIGIDFAPSAQNKKTIRRMSKPFSAQPDCDFLNKLPAELRNEIYKLLAHNCDTVSVRDDRVCAPAIGRVCRQIEREMSSIFVSEAPRHAPIVELNLTDFTPGLLRPVIEHLPAPLPGASRRFTTTMTLTNNCAWYKTGDFFVHQFYLVDWAVEDAHRAAQGGQPHWYADTDTSVIPRDDSWLVVSDIRFRWDPKTIDLADLRRRSDLFATFPGRSGAEVAVALAKALDVYESKGKEVV